MGGSRGAFVLAAALQGFGCSGDTGCADLLEDGGGGDGGDCEDLDGDKHFAVGCDAGDDCDDGNAAVHPGIVEDEAWRVEVVEVGAHSSWLPDVAVDPDGVVYVRYVDAGGESRLAERSAAGWSTEPFLPELGPYELLIDQGGTWHALGQAGGLTYLTKTDGEWSSEVVDPAPEDPRSASLVVDADDRVHVAFAATGALDHAVRDAGEWAISVVYSAEPCDVRAGAIAVDASGSVHIAFGQYCATKIDQPGASPYYASNASGEWQVEELSPDLQDEYWLRLAVDRTDSPHILFWGTAHSTEYALATDGGWSVEDLPGGNALAIDDRDDAHVLYVDGRDLWHAQREGASWEAETISSYGVPLEDMLIDGDGIHVAFMTNDLMYGHRSLANGIDDDCDGEAF